MVLTTASFPVMPDNFNSFATSPIQKIFSAAAQASPVAVTESDQKEICPY
jgi:hypothetical protein